MKTPLYHTIIPFCLLLFSCSTVENHCNDNDLIPKEVKIKYEHNLLVPEESDVYQSFDKNEFVDKLIDIALSKKVAVFDQQDTARELSKEEVNKIVGQWNDTLIGVDEKKADTVLIVKTNGFNKNELVRLLIEETWCFNASKFTMTKDVKRWCPVRAFSKPIDSIQTEEVKKMLFWVKQNGSQFDKGNVSLLKENVSYEFSLTNENVPEWLRDFNHERFISLLLQQTLGDKVPAFDFFDQKKRLSNAEIRENLGETTKYYFVENKETGNYDTVIVSGRFFPEEITSVLFVEDWYIDWRNLHVFKKVKSVAPVRHYINYRDNGDEDVEKKIPFIVHFN